MKNGMNQELYPQRKLGSKILSSGPQLALGIQTVLMVITLFFSGSAHAVACYTAAEAEAEQGVRIHSELMVIGLNCKHMTPAGQRDYYAQYKEFSARNGVLFSNYERSLLSFYTRAGFAAPEGELNRLRTTMANKISGDAAKMRPDLFCAYYAPRIPKAAAMTPAQIRAWASAFFRSHPLSQPICSNTKITYR
jgi:hypothetical protein